MPQPRAGRSAAAAAAAAATSSSSAPLLGGRRSAPTRRAVAAAAAKAPYPPPAAAAELPTDAPADVVYDAVIVGGGMGGLTTAAKLVEKGAKVLVLEKYLVPGGSAAHYKRAGYTFDVGSSMMFGFGDAGTTNLITKALEAVGKRLETVPDPTQVHYHLPRSAAHPEVSTQRWFGRFSSSGWGGGGVRRCGGAVTNGEGHIPGRGGGSHHQHKHTETHSTMHASTPPTTTTHQGLEVRVWRAYDDFVAELTRRFPHEAAGIKAFYGECWRVFNALNSLGEGIGCSACVVCVVVAMAL